LKPADNGQVDLVAFDLIEHPKLLSQPDAEPDELIRSALEKFASRNNVQGEQVVIGVPGQQTFARFSKLPPVDPKKLPELVKFEAGQQIPFAMDDVVWDYQVFQAKDSPDVEVGIFAMRKDLIRKHLDYFHPLKIAPIAIQTIPSALYNFCKYDGQGSAEPGKGTVVVDVGAQNTDLIIVEANSAWTRNIPLGGNNFTEALVKQFKLAFPKAESLKRTAAESKHARQVFQAMRPVFADLVAEIQRSLGFYSSTHRDVQLESVVACGNAFQLTGLQKYLENNLTIGNVRTLTKFEKLVTSANTNAPQFADNVMSFGAAYGLALQGLGLAPISANLLPHELARVALWNRKRPWFIGAAACLGLASVLPWWRETSDRSALAAGQDDGNRAKSIVDRAQDLSRKFSEAQAAAGGEKEKVDKLFELHKDRALVPQILQLVHEALPEVDPMVLAADTPEKFKKLVGTNPDRFARPKRGQVQIEALKVEFHKDILALTPPAAPVVEAVANATPGYESFSSGARGGVMSDGGGHIGRTGRVGGSGGPSGGSSGGSGGEGSGESGGGENPGFYVSFSARMLAGTTPSEAQDYVDQVLRPRLMELGNRPGLGFHIPEVDEKNVENNKVNFNAPTPQRDPISLQGEQSGMALPANPPAVPGKPMEIPVINPDPVTGESRQYDWKIGIGFKIKMGDAPPKADAPPTDDGPKS